MKADPKYILFLEDLSIERDKVRAIVEKETTNRYQCIWPEDIFDSNNVEILVTSNHEVQKGILERWPNLKMISLAYTGYERSNSTYFTSKGIKVYYVPGYSTNSVAELILALILTILRKLINANQNVRLGKWDGNSVAPGIELHGKSVAIIGTGRIGLRVASLLSSFDCKLIGWSKTEKAEFHNLDGVYYSDITHVFSSADIIVLQLPLTDSTKEIVGKELIEVMKPNAILINASRSGLVNLEDLVSALEENRILGAGIDVFDDDFEKGAPPKAALNRLLKLENVVLTPHLGFKTNEALQRLAISALSNIGNFLNGIEENQVQKS